MEHGAAAAWSDWKLQRRTVAGSHAAGCATCYKPHAVGLTALSGMCSSLFWDWTSVEWRPSGAKQMHTCRAATAHTQALQHCHDSPKEGVQARLPAQAG